ncbi:MAG: hypothetical protein ACI9O4_002565, partial [Chitinophagales bacterium]
PAIKISNPLQNFHCQLKSKPAQKPKTASWLSVLNKNKLTLT